MLGAKNSCLGAGIQGCDGIREGDPPAPHLPAIPGSGGTIIGGGLVPDTLKAHNGLEMSRPASPNLVSRQSQTLGWPGRLHRVVRRPELRVHSSINGSESVD